MSLRSPSKKLSASDFILLDKIGEGAYGKVYKATWKQSNRSVAIKIIELESDWLPLLAEVNMVIDLRHESIVSYYGWFFRDRELWLVMEYCDGGSLADVIQMLGTGLNEMQLSAVARCVLSSLAYVHGLKRIHRDIKGGNLLITSTGLVKLCDFGIAAQLDANVLQRGTVIGSPYWMAPEVISSKGHDTKADIWSFGVTILELYSGAPPHHELPVYNAMLAIQSEPPPKAPDSASHVFRSFITKVLVKDPEARQTAEELLVTPFILKCGDHSRQIIADLFVEYQRKKAELGVGVKPGPSPRPEDQPLDSLTREAVGSILYGGTYVRRDGTTVEADGTFIAKDASFVRDSGAVKVQHTEASDPLGAWSMHFLEQPTVEKKVKEAQRRNFANFSEGDLNYLLESLRQLALTEIAEGQSRHTVLSHYEEVRVAIVDELRRRRPTVPPDFAEIA
jgi:serine/threonine protein kinase